MGRRSFGICVGWQLEILEILLDLAAMSCDYYYARKTSHDFYFPVIERRFRPTWPPWAGVTRTTRSLLWISINNAPRPLLPFWHMSGHLKGIKHKIIFLLQEVIAVWNHWRVTIWLSYDLRWEFTWTIPSSPRPHRHVGIPQNSCSAWNKKSPKNS